MGNMSKESFNPGQGFNTTSIQIQETTVTENHDSYFTNSLFSWPEVVICPSVCMSVCAYLIYFLTFWQFIKTKVSMDSLHKGGGFKTIYMRKG